MGEHDRDTPLTAEDIVLAGTAILLVTSELLALSGCKSSGLVDLLLRFIHSLRAEPPSHDTTREPGVGAVL